MAVVDMCPGQRKGGRPQLRLESLGGQDGTRLRLLEAHQGKKVTVGIGNPCVCALLGHHGLLLTPLLLQVLFPSGAFVRADLADWGMSLSVRGPGMDYGKTRGLCGTFDRNSSNDFHDRDGDALDPADVRAFIEHWRSGCDRSRSYPLSAGSRHKKRVCATQAGSWGELV